MIAALAQFVSGSGSSFSISGPLLLPNSKSSRLGMTRCVAHAFTCLATVLITAVAGIGQLYHMERRRFFIEPDALLIILLVLAVLTSLYWL